ncbi:hypothetical protein [Leucobacter triazinivorans]|uniref:Uncharacterized protein n=1 Tax=Leucobacter triazinivorans TaxID=1784719 RepID=A0A4V0Z1B3_9MICO|nr:hypothetical protein [Leucobacter triazinivorans]QBE47809.1 hypothetical protein EVS81_02330 [Leucobacter triazinivorans]
MKRSLGLWLGGVWFCAALALMFTLDERAVWSTAWITNIVVSLSIVLSPILLGLGAADSVRVLRAEGARELVYALPIHLSWRMLGSRALVSALWTTSGMLIALVIGYVLTIVHGATPMTSAVFEIALAVLGSFAFVMLGQAVGAMIPSWLTPPVVAIGLYLAYGFNLGGVGALFYFVSAGDTLSSSFVLRREIFVVYAATFGLIWVLALLLIWVVMGQRRIARNLVTLLLAAVLVGGGTSVLAAEGDGVFVYVPVGERVCSNLPESRARVCLPREQQESLAGAIELLAPVAARVSELEPTAGGATYSPFTAGTKQNIYFEPLIGEDEADRDDITMSVVLSLADCGDALPARPDIDVALSIVATWIMPGFSGVGMLMETADFSDGPPTLAQAQEGLLMLQRCEGDA